MKISIIKDENIDYCREAPFHPQQKYPEYPFADTSKANSCYEAVRGLLYQLGMDSAHFGTASWNPLGDLIKPGDHVFIKPNLVSHHNKKGPIEAIITHGSVIRAILDYAYIALAGRGALTIGDAPYIDTDFNEALKVTGIDTIAAYYESHSAVPMSVIDMRGERGPIKLGLIKKEVASGDPAGYTVVDLKKDSEHNDIIGDFEKFSLVFYDRHEMVKHHNPDKNEYCISRSILNADVVINIPKMKTHAKTGISCAMKSLVGINGYKGWLPHHRSGPFEQGGDEYQYSDARKDLFIRVRDQIPAKNSLLYAVPLRAVNGMIYLTQYIVPYKENIHGGSWYGNDTLPRTIVDLNKIFYYADKNGHMKDTPQRKQFILVDGITAGEKEGPMSNSAKKCGILIAGHNPVEVDYVCSLVMGYDPLKILTTRRAISVKKYPLFVGNPGDIEIVSDKCDNIDSVYNVFNSALVPPCGWIGHIEYERKPSAVIQVPLNKVASPADH